MLDIVPMLLGGLAIFLFAIGELSHTMQAALSEKVKDIIGRYTGNIIASVLVGTVVTILLGSSSAAIIITIVFVNARTLSFRQAMGIVMGANIGTTFSSQIIALDVGQYAYVLLTIGLALRIFTKKHEQTGAGLVYFGMLFFGIWLMGYSVEPLKDSTVFTDWMAELDHPIRGALTGGIVTLIIQSSSATVGLAITLAKQNLISAAGGIAVMLGAELGTCSDTILATIGGKRPAIKTGLFHLLFNLSTILLSLLLFAPFVQFVLWISAGQPIDRIIANAHVLFNVLGVVLVLPFSGIIAQRFDPQLSAKA